MVDLPPPPKRGDEMKMNCKNPLCGQELVRLIGNAHCDAYGCDNWHCYLFKQPQKYQSKNPRALPPTARYRRQSPTYEAFKEHKRQNYQLLRNLGIEPKRASLISSSSKKTQLTLAMGTNE